MVNALYILFSMHKTYFETNSVE